MRAYARTHGGGLGDPLENALSAGVVDHRPHVGVLVQGVPHLQCINQRQQCLNKRVVHLAVGVHALH